MKRTGKSVACFDGFYFDKELNCKSCSTYCQLKCTLKEGCELCKSKNTFGLWCDQTCPENCLDPNPSERKCNRLTGFCSRCKWNYIGNKCDDCIYGYYGEKCDKNCENGCDLTVNSCERDGACGNCKSSFFGTKCGFNCPEGCDLLKGNCHKTNGYCSGCKTGKYGDICDKDCSPKCERNKCQQENGNCVSCEIGYYGLKCEKMCLGCNNGCEMNGICKEHLCRKGFYGGKTCDKKCKPKCNDSGCDQFTSECLTCPIGTWGTECQIDCNSKCKNLECCSKDKAYPSYKFDLKKYDYYSTIKLSIGTPPQEIEAIIDFSNSSTLAILDKDISFQMITGKNLEESLFPSFKCSSSENCRNSSDLNSTRTSVFNGVSIEGKPYSDILNLGKIKVPINFILAEKIYVEDNFKMDTYPNFKISAIIGFGFFSDFNEDLYSGGILSKNLVIISLQKSEITIGDYPYDLKNFLYKISTCSSIKIFKHGEENALTCKVQGFAYNYREAFINKYNLTLSLNDEDIYEMDLILSDFFEIVYFGKYMNSECFINSKSQEEKTYYCIDNFKVKVLPKFGIVMENMIYFIDPVDLFIKEPFPGLRQLFKIKLKKQTNVILGKNFFTKFNVILDQGKGLIGFLGGDKRALTAEIKTIPDNWPSSNTGIIISPGKLASIVIFTALLVAVMGFTCYYCHKRSQKLLDSDNLIGKRIKISYFYYQLVNLYLNKIIYL